LAVGYAIIGQPDKSLAKALEAQRLDPEDSLSNLAVAQSYVDLDRYDEARATINQAVAKKIDIAPFHLISYQLGFIQNDSAVMARELDFLSKNSPWAAENAINQQAQSEAYDGHLEKARAIFHRCADSQKSGGRKEPAAESLLILAKILAVTGDTAGARKEAAAAVEIAQAADVNSDAAIAFALAGDTARAESLASKLVKDYPSDSDFSEMVLPEAGAAIASDRNDPAKAVELLQPAQPYDLAFFFEIPYVRGQAYLQLHKGPEAAAEFQKILDHRGILRNRIFGALAHLQSGRAYALAGDTSKARTAYQDFFALWKDADPNIPILQQAKSEYAKLK